MAGWRGRCPTLVLAVFAAGDPSSASAVDPRLLADRDKACAFMATAASEDVAMVEIWLTILQHDSADSRALVRDDLQRLDGEARTIGQAIAAMNAQIAVGHEQLRGLRSRLDALEALPESVTLRDERRALQADMRATSIELIETSLGLHDANVRLTAIEGAIAGRRDSAAINDAAQSAARENGDAIRECARRRRARSMAVAPGVGAQRQRAQDVR